MKFFNCRTEIEDSIWVCERNGFAQTAAVMREFLTLNANESAKTSEYSLE